MPSCSEALRMMRCKSLLRMMAHLSAREQEKPKVEGLEERIEQTDLLKEDPAPVLINQSALALAVSSYMVEIVGCIR